MINKSDKTLKQRLKEAGYEVERFYDKWGSFRGMVIKKDGVKVHNTVVASYDFGLELAIESGK